MSDETGIRFSVLYCVSGCYAEVHISWEIVMGLTGAKVGRNFEMTKFLHTEITENTERVKRTRIARIARI